MPKYTLRQGNTVAKLSELAYHQPEGFQENNTWHVSEETISADVDTKLTSGPATIRYESQEFPVTVTVLEFETVAGEDDEPEEGDPACSIEIGYAEGLPKLALALGLLEHLTPKQQRALVG